MKNRIMATILALLFSGLLGCTTTPSPQADKTETQSRLESVKQKLRITGEKLNAVSDKYFPQKPEAYLGKSRPGVRIGYAYDFIRQPGKTGQYRLLKIAMCAEKKDQYISYTDPKNNAAGVAAVLATPLVLSAPVLVDPIFFIERGLRKSREKKIEKKGSLDTGRSILCGKKEPAPGETLIVQSTGDNAVAYVKTDAKGYFNLAGIHSRTGDSPYLNLFIRLDESVYYLTTIFPH